MSQKIKLYVSYFRFYFGSTGRANFRHRNTTKLAIEEDIQEEKTNIGILADDGDNVLKTLFLKNPETSCRSLFTNLFPSTVYVKQWHRKKQLKL